MQYYSPLSQKGNTLPVDNNIAYQYSIDSRSIDAVGRLLYQYRLYRIYGEIDAGVATLNANGYALDSSSISVNYNDKSQTNFTYGLSIGLLRKIAKQRENHEL